MQSQTHPNLNDFTSKSTVSQFWVPVTCLLDAVEEYGSNDAPTLLDSSQLAELQTPILFNALGMYQIHRLSVTAYFCCIPYTKFELFPWHMITLRKFSPSPTCVASRRSCSGRGVLIYYVSLPFGARGHMVKRRNMITELEFFVNAGMYGGELEHLYANRLKDLEKMRLLISLVDHSHEALCVKVDHLPDVDD
ncbi:hypothetical protein Tco_1347092 [Tanacetum coccineum]